MAQANHVKQLMETECPVGCYHSMIHADQIDGSVGRASDPAECHPKLSSMDGCYGFYEELQKCFAQSPVVSMIGNPAVWSACRGQLQILQGQGPAVQEQLAAVQHIIDQKGLDAGQQLLHQKQPRRGTQMNPAAGVPIDCVWKDRTCAA